MSSLQKKIDDLKQQVHEAKNNLANIDKPTAPLPELIDSANLIRSNEYLIQVNEKKDLLLYAYKKYLTALELISSYLPNIQFELKNMKKTRTKSRKSSKNTRNKKSKKTYTKSRKRAKSSKKKR